MIRGYRYRYVLVEDILERRDNRDLFEEIRGKFSLLFGSVGLAMARLKGFNHRRGLIIRVTLEKLDELLAVLAYIRGIKVKRISGTLKKVLQSD